MWKVCDDFVVVNVYCFNNSCVGTSFYIACIWLFASMETSHQYPSFLASELLQCNVIALVEGSHTKIPACALATIANIPLIHLRANYPTLDRCGKAIHLSADFKDYAHASLDIINTFQWKNIAIVADGKEHRLYCFRICRFVSSNLIVRLFICSSVRVFVVVFLFGRLVVCSEDHLFVWLFRLLVVCSCVRVIDCFFGLLAICSRGRLFFWSFGHLFPWSSIRFVYFFCLFRGSFRRSCLLLRNIPRFKVHLESAAANRERRQKRQKWKRQSIDATFSGKHSKPWPRSHSPLHHWKKNPTADDTNGLLAFVHSFFIHFPRRPNTKSGDHWLNAEHLSNTDQSS